MQIFQAWNLQEPQLLPVNMEQNQSTVVLPLVKKYATKLLARARVKINAIQILATMAASVSRFQTLRILLCMALLHAYAPHIPQATFVNTRFQNVHPMMIVKMVAAAIFQGRSATAYEDIMDRIVMVVVALIDTACSVAIAMR